MATTPQSLDSLRRQLEGRWERIEQARALYTELTRRLASFQWKRALRRQLELLTEARKQEAELTEVLSYLAHRASSEQWLPDHPGLGVLRELHARRAKLKALGSKRLARPLSQEGASFAEVLEQLEALAVIPVAQPPGPSEPVLLEGRMSSWLSPGRFWLTPGRLVWSPWFGEPVQVMLAPLAREDISLLPGGGGVRVEGKERLTLLSLFQSGRLVALLELCRRLHHQGSVSPQENDVVTSPVYRRHEDYTSPELWGLGIFRPGYMALLPVRRPTLLESCRNLVGLGARRPTSAELQRLKRLVEHLRPLPSAELDQALRELTLARGGKLWPSTELHRLMTSGEDVRFQVPGYELVAPGAASSGIIHQFLARHSPGRDSHIAGRGGKRWWRHYKEKVGIVAGLAIQSLPHFLIPASLPPAWLWSCLSFIGYALYIWSGTRYARAFGIPWWGGLLLSIMCTPAVVVMLFLSPKRKPPKLPG